MRQSPGTEALSRLNLSLRAKAATVMPVSLPLRSALGDLRRRPGGGAGALREDDLSE